MKSLLVILTLALSLGAMASETGSGPNGPYTVGPLGYTDPFYSSAGTSAITGGTALGTSVSNPLVTTAGTSVAFNLKAIAIAVENDAQNYLQTGEMSEILGYTVKNVLGQNSDLSVEEAVSIVLDFAAVHARM